MPFLFLLALLFAAPVGLVAQVATVPMSDPVYQDLDRLLATGLVDYGFSGQRPYTRREIARMVASVQRKLPSPRVSGATTRIIDRLKARFGPEIALLTGEVEQHFPPHVFRWRADAMALSSPARGIPDDPTGQVDATINPLLNDRMGRVYGEGGGVALEAEYERAFSPSVNVRVRPRVYAGYHAGDAFAQGSLQAASIAAQWRNLIAELGRQEIVLGQGMEGGMLSSTSARPLDMLRFSTGDPFRVPIVSMVLGSMRGNLLFADLGANQRFPHSVLIEYKLSAFPFKRFELAAAVSAVQLGRGAPRTDFWEHVKDLIPALKYLMADDDSTQFSNKLAGWEYRLRIPEWRGLQLYAEHAFEDMDPRRWGSTFWEDGGHIVGLSLQNLAADGALSMAAELHHTGLRFYQHATFTSGMAFNGTLLGSPLGNEADAGYLRLRWDEGAATSFTLDLARERRDGDVITTAADGPDNENFRFVRVAFHPAEMRTRGVGSWTRNAGGRRTTLQLGVERVRNFAFVAGESRTNALVGAVFDVYRR